MIPVCYTAVTKERRVWSTVPCSRAHLRWPKLSWVFQSGAFFFESHRDKTNANVGEDKTDISDDTKGCSCLHLDTAGQKCGAESEVSS